MNLNKILKIIGAIVAVAGIAAAIYFAVKKFTDKKEPEYFDDNDFFECDNDLEIIDVTEEAPQAEEVLAEQTPKKKAAKKAEEKKLQEKLEEGRTERKEIREEFYESDGEGEVTFTADTIEDLISQIENADYLVRRDIRSSFERQVGQKFDSAI